MTQPSGSEITTYVAVMFAVTVAIVVWARLFGAL
jgi:hypothetical protein